MRKAQARGKGGASSTSSSSPVPLSTTSLFPRHHSISFTTRLLQILALILFGAGLVGGLQLASLGRVERISGAGLKMKLPTGRSAEEVVLAADDGASPSPPSKRDEIAHALWGNNTDASLLRLGLVRPEVLSWSPRIILFHNFLSSEECDAMVQLATPSLEKSTVVDHKNGKSVLSNYRTSTGMFISNEERNTLLVQAIEKRIATFSMVPVENGENIQVLRYNIGQYYRPHPDYFVDEPNLKRGGQRVATMLMYLVEPSEGGETIFPRVGKGKKCSCGGQMQKGLCVKSKKGDAVLFWSTTLAGKEDEDSLHASCSVVKGEKWSATKWMRQNVFT